MNKVKVNDFRGLISADQAAALVGVTRRWFYELVKMKKMPVAIEIFGRNLMWNKKSVEAAWEKMKNKPKVPRVDWR